MKDNHISISEAKGRLGELVKRAAYGKEHFILEFRDKPQAAIVSIEDYLKIERTRAEGGRLTDEMRALRERIARETGRVFDTANVLREIRDERDEQITGLR